MTTGQVTFNNHKMVRKVLVKERENATVNRLNKTRVEKFPDFRAEKEEYLKTKRKEERKGRDEQRAKEKEEKRDIGGYFMDGTNPAIAGNGLVSVFDLQIHNNNSI